MTTKEQFLSSQERSQPITLPKEFSDEEMARDWTLSDADRQEVGKYRTNSRLFHHYSTLRCAFIWQISQ